MKALFWGRSSGGVLRGKLFGVPNENEKKTEKKTSCVHPNMQLYNIRVFFGGFFFNLSSSPKRSPKTLVPRRTLLEEIDAK